MQLYIELFLFFFSFLKIFLWLHQVSVMVLGLSCPAALSSPLGIEPASPASEGGFVMAGTTKKVPRIVFLIRAEFLPSTTFPMLPLTFPKGRLIPIRMRVQATQRVTFALRSGYNSEFAEGGSQG